MKSLNRTTARLGSRCDLTSGSCPAFDAYCAANCAPPTPPTPVYKGCGTSWSITNFVDFRPLNPSQNGAKVLTASGCTAYW